MLSYKQTKIKEHDNEKLELNVFYEMRIILFREKVVSYVQ